MRKVQSYIANVSFPTSLEEMEELVNGEYYMDMEALLLFDDASFTAPKWAAKGDIVFFYHAKSAITKIRHLKSLLKKEKEKYKQTYDEIEKLVSYQGSGASSEEIVILQVKDKSKLDSVKEKINTRLQERKEAFESYLPKEVGKIENNILIVKGNYVILCISNDNKQVNNILKDSNLW